MPDTNLPADASPKAPEHHAVWVAMDDYLNDLLITHDQALQTALHATEEAGMPQQHVAPNQGKLLHLLAQMSGAQRILEVGTLGGYSTIWLARALPDGGQLVTLELNPKHADIAQANLVRAGVADRVEIRIGDAKETLATMQEAGERYDFTFIDADKPNNTAYLRAALAMSPIGSTIVLDNVVRLGHVLDIASEDANVQGVREVLQMIHDEPRITATALQTVGHKGYDGFVLMRVIA